MSKFNRMFLLVLLSLFSASCVSGGASTFRYSHVFQPQYSISVVNNTNVLADIEINGDTVARNLAPGGTYYWPIYSFRQGDRISVVAKGHRDGAFVGVASKSFYLYGGSGGYNSGRRSEVWEIRGFSEPRIY